jgi:predicted esterase
MGPCPQQSLSIKDIEVEFQRDSYLLSGTLTLPAITRKGSHTGVVIMHGSGPNDRDGSLNLQGMVFKPYRELATKLAEDGVIVLRYDKRSYLMKQRGHFDRTLMPDDFIQDSRAAIDFLRSVDEVDTCRIFFIGHSQGGSLASEVTSGKGITGSILLAPGLLPFFQQVHYQLNYQINYYESRNSQSQFDELIERNRQLITQMKDIQERLDHGSIRDEEIILGSTKSFILRLQEITQDLPMKISRMKEPVLIINGSLDLLCPAELLEDNRAILRQKHDLTIKIIDLMTHNLYPLGMLVLDKRVAEGLLEWMEGI